MGPITVTVDVTKDDCSRGRPGRCRECPVARAAARALPSHVVLVGFFPDLTTPTQLGLKAWYDGYPDDFVLAALPDDVAGRIMAFDEHLFMTPFSFEVTLT